MLHKILVLLFVSGALGHTIPWKGQCDLPAPAANLDMEFVKRVSGNQGWKIAVGSYFSINRLAEILTGKGPYTPDELHGLCSHDSWDPNPSADHATAQWIESGFNSTVRRHCEYDEGKETIVTCEIIPDNPGEEVKHSRTLESLTLTDNDEFLVFATCWEDGGKGWEAVAPADKVISPKNLETIMEHVQSLEAFNDHEHFVPAYENCPN